MKLPVVLAFHSSGERLLLIVGVRLWCAVVGCLCTGRDAAGQGKRFSDDPMLNLIVPTLTVREVKKRERVTAFGAGRKLER
jgi:hypothetical protein